MQLYVMILFCQLASNEAEWSGLIIQPFLENNNTKQIPQKLLKSDSFPRLLQGGNLAGN